MRKILFKFLIVLFFILLWAGKSDASSYIIANKTLYQWVLAVPCGNYMNDQQLIIWNFSDTLDDQKFLLLERPNGNITIVPAASPNKAIGIPNGIIGQNKPLILWDSNNNLDQQWRIEEVDNGHVIIRSCVDRNYVLAPTTGNLDARIVIQRYTGAEHQKWALISTQSKFYKLYKEMWKDL